MAWCWESAPLAQRIEGVNLRCQACQGVAQASYTRHKTAQQGCQRPRERWLRQVQPQAARPGLPVCAGQAPLLGQGLDGGLEVLDAILAVVTLLRATLLVTVSCCW